MKRAAYEDEEKAIIEQMYLMELDKKNKAVKEQMYLMEFNKKKKKEIKPIMEKIQKYIMSLGYPVEIAEISDAISSDNKQIKASIAIRFMRIEDLSRPVYHNPFFSVTCDKSEQEVVLCRSALFSVKNKKNGNWTEERISLKDITKNIIQDKIYEVLQEIY